MHAEARRWGAVAAIVAAFAAALVGIFDLASGTWTRAAIGFPIALVAAVAVRELGPDLKPTNHRDDRVATAAELAVFGICTTAGIVATDLATDADEAARYIGYFLALVVATYVSRGVGTWGRRANGR
jgi:hypothetical protein